MTDTPILALLRAGLPVEVSSRDAGGDYDQMCASATVHGGSGVPHNRRYGGTAQSRAALWRIVCVNNSANGAREVAALVVDLLDATTKLYSGKQQLSSARYGYILKLLQLKQVAGNLQEQDLIDVNNGLRKG